MGANHLAMMTQGRVRPPSLAGPDHQEARLVEDQFASQVFRNDLKSRHHLDSRHHIMHFALEIIH